ncbi:MAG: HAD family hydrolase [Gemmatimonadota bacterium]|nr:HAD family hydrolase [Gemmatimonadota bacterium]
MSPGHLVGFDLDDTLYPERAYARSGLLHVGRQLATRYGIPTIPDRLIEELQAGRRGDIFDAVLTECGLPPDLVPGLVEQYRSHAPDIALYPDVSPVLDALSSRAHLVLITDGPLVCQERKIAALGLADRFDLILCTDRWGPPYWKPHPRAFTLAAEHFEVAGRGAAYVANDPRKDFRAPRELGWRTIRVDRSDALNPVSAGESIVDADVSFPDLLGVTAHLLGEVANRDGAEAPEG